jgi:hypothetical protein
MKKEEINTLEKDAVGFWLIVSQSLTTVVPLMDLIAFFTSAALFAFGA